MARTSVELTNSAGRFRPASSIAGDVWHGETRAPAYEWWYFDALSNDGRDALVIIFLTNFIFSPRYNRAAAESHRQSQLADSASQFPALAVFFYRDGRPLFRAINEYAPDDVQASTSQPDCRIRDNSFRLVRDGSRLCYQLKIKTAVRRERLLQAQLAWTLQDGDFFEEECEDTGAPAPAHHWNMVAPRCDVAGEIALIGRTGAHSFEQDFHGNGYHDHNWDQRWMPATIAEWQWGRIHFPAATAVFYRYRERDQTQDDTRLYLIQDGLLSVSAPHLTTTASRRHSFGLRYPRLLQFQTDVGGPTLNVRQQRVLDSSFFYLRFLSQAALEMADGRVQQAVGITEHLMPRPLGYSWLWWLVNMRIGRNGRGAFLP